MATTVTGAMSLFLSAIQPTTNQIAETSTSHQVIRDYLRGELTVISDYLTGSYARNTMLRQSRDVDVFLVLDISYFTGNYISRGYRDQANGPANLLYRIRELLRRRYQNTNISRDGQAVRVDFSHVHIDVVPAFVNVFGSGYLIPDPR
jgi:tRNA nucleotidyltransferase (CCA-adding enzyme)